VCDTLSKGNAPCYVCQRLNDHAHLGRDLAFARCRRWRPKLHGILV
jgi:hypothetical protein